MASFAERQPLREDDLHLRDALTSKGVSVVPIVWDDEDPDWSQFDACLIRSVSDYHMKYGQFVNWVTRVGAATSLWNSPDLTLWNANKAYLRDLAAGGVPTIPTEWIPRGSDINLIEVLDFHGWTRAVAKPMVGLGAQNLLRVSRGDDEGQRAVGALLQQNGALIQPFLPSVEVEGESSLVYFGGKLTHAVKKRPAAGDFRVQKTWGGTFEDWEPNSAEIGVARAALDHIEPTPLFARVDLVTGPSGDPLLIELELIEPDLFFRHEPAAAGQFADVIATRLIC